MGDVQWLPGYCVVLTDNPAAERLSDLSRTKRSAYLGSMADLGEAVERACKEADPAFRRVNLEILGNAGWERETSGSPTATSRTNSPWVHASSRRSSM